MTKKGIKQSWMKLYAMGIASHAQLLKHVPELGINVALMRALDEKRIAREEAEEKPKEHKVGSLFLKQWSKSMAESYKQVADELKI